MRPLPVCPPPANGELLTSWFARLARANCCSENELARHLRLESAVIGDQGGAKLRRDLPLIAAAGRIPTRRARRMLISEWSTREPALISVRPFQHCIVCVRQARFPEFELRHWRFSWATRCKICGSVLTPIGDCQGETLRGLLQREFLAGAQVLRRIHQKGTPTVRRRLADQLRFIGAGRGYRPGSSVLYRFGGGARVKALAWIYFAKIFPIDGAAAEPPELTPNQRRALRPPPVDMS